MSLHCSQAQWFLVVPLAAIGLCCPPPSQLKVHCAPVALQEIKDLLPTAEIAGNCHSQKPLLRP